MSRIFALLAICTLHDGYVAMATNEKAGAVYASPADGLSSRIALFGTTSLSHMVLAQPPVRHSRAPKTHAGRKAILTYGKGFVEAAVNG